MASTTTATVVFQSVQRKENNSTRNGDWVREAEFLGRGVCFDAPTKTMQKTTMTPTFLAGQLFARLAISCMTRPG
ncbi:hypothetical protein IF2G_07925 [Cordyceps javanica]|nr:hypothetical protein IF2G_07925 [Cordyceps javanica]